MYHQLIGSRLPTLPTTPPPFEFSSCRSGIKMLSLNVNNMISVEDLVLQATPFAEYGRVWLAGLLKTYACIRPYQITVIGYL